MVIDQHFRPTMVCQVEGQLISDHPRCRGCSILIGPGHYDQTAHYGLCGSCRTRPTLQDVGAAPEPTLEQVMLWGREDMALSLSEQGFSIQYIALEVGTSRRNTYTMIERAKRRRSGK